MQWDAVSARRLGETIRRLRLDRGLSQESLAFQAGITKNQVQLLEYGRASGRADDDGCSNPHLATLIGLAGVLGITAADLLDAAEL